MTILGILLALLGACCYAAAATLQHGAVRTVSPEGMLRWHQLRTLVARRRWLAGLLAQCCGGALHVGALCVAPLTVVQPVGVLAIGMTVVFTAVANRSTLDTTTVVAVLASSVGVGLFVLLAVPGAVQTTVSVAAQTRVLLVAAPTVAAGVLLARTSRGWPRCLAFATTAGIAFGVVSVLTRAIAGDVGAHGLAGTQIGSALGIVAGIAVGAWCVQQAYASGRPDTVVACQTVIDPAVGVLVGALLFGEVRHATTGTVLGELAGAALTVAGVLALARRHPGSRPGGHPGNPAGPSDKESGLNPSDYGLDRPLRIVVGADTFPPDVNGAARFAHRLAVGLAGRGHDVHVICPSDRGPARTERITGVDGLTVHRVRAHRTPYHPTFRICLPWQANRAARDLLAELAPDVVHTQAHFAVGRAVVRAAADRAVPLVATNHFMPENLFGHLRVPGRLRAPIARLAWRDLMRVIAPAAVVTAPTPTAVHMLRANGFTGIAVPVSCGVDLGRYWAGTPAPAADPTVLFVGRLDEEKRVDELLRAVPLLPAPVRVEIVGDGSCRAALEALADRLGITDRVRFRGFVSDADLFDAYARCWVFCMPGVAELQSIATMEAMAAGKPVVAADAVALPHLVRPGRNGWLFPPGDVPGLAGALTSVITAPATLAAMGAASREIIAGHDIQASLDAFEAHYAQALGAVRTRAAVRVA